MLGTTPYLIPIVGRPLLAKGISTKTDLNLPPTMANVDLVEGTSLCIFCVVAFSIVLVSRRTSRSPTRSSIRVVHLNPVILMIFGTTVAVVPPKFGMIGYARSRIPVPLLIFGTTVSVVPPTFGMIGYARSTIFGMTVPVVAPTFGMIRYVGIVVSSGNVNIFCSALRPTNLLPLSINCLLWTRSFLLSTLRSPGVGAPMSLVVMYHSMH